MKAQYAVINRSTLVDHIIVPDAGSFSSGGSLESRCHKNTVKDGLEKAYEYKLDVKQ